jgi:hypothetical protein
MKGSKKEGKRVLTRKFWTRRWSLELTLPQKINCSNVMYSHHMPSHKAKVPPKTHLIAELSVTMAIANLTVISVVVDDNEDIED